VNNYRVTYQTKTELSAASYEDVVEFYATTRKEAVVKAFDYLCDCGHAVLNLRAEYLTEVTS